MWDTLFESTVWIFMLGFASFFAIYFFTCFCFFACCFGWESGCGRGELGTLNFKYFELHGKSRRRSWEVLCTVF